MGKKTALAAMAAAILLALTSALSAVMVSVAVSSAHAVVTIVRPRHSAASSFVIRLWRSTVSPPGLTIRNRAYFSLYTVDYIRRGA